MTQTTVNGQRTSIESYLAEKLNDMVVLVQPKGNTLARYVGPIGGSHIFISMNQERKITVHGATLPVLSPGTTHVSLNGIVMTDKYSPDEKSGRLFLYNLLDDIFEGRE